MSDHGHRNRKGQGKATDRQPPPKQSRNIAVLIPQPFKVHHEASNEENQQYAEERINRQSQLRTAQRLNIISVGGALVALLSLGAVYWGLIQSRQTFETGERAWVLVVKVPIVPMGQQSTANIQEIISAPLTADTDLSVPIIFKNAGLSPALDVDMRIDTPEFIGESCPQSHVMSPYQNVITIAQGEIASNVNERFRLSNQCVDALKGGTAIFTLKGLIWYHDIFQKYHETHFCYRYEGIPGTGHVSACSSGNEAN